jgi:GR25 family glycosyltransferase involved in LPS biosynthesis
MIKIDIEKSPTFIVSLPEGPREKECVKYMESFGIKAVPIYGFRASNCGISTEYYNSVKKDRMGVKSIVAGLSHFSVWATIKWAVESGAYPKDQPFLVVEDDCKFVSDNWKEKLTEELQHVPEDWDVIYVGSCCAAPYEYNRHIGGNVYRLTHGMCTHCYYVTYEGACMLMKTNQKVWCPIDIQMLVDSIPFMKFYGILPRLAYQDGANLDP